MFFEDIIIDCSFNFKIVRKEGIRDNNRELFSLTLIVERTSKRVQNGDYVVRILCEKKVHVFLKTW